MQLSTTQVSFSAKNRPSCQQADTFLVFGGPPMSSQRNWLSLDWKIRGRVKFGRGRHSRVTTLADTDVPAASTALAVDSGDRCVGNSAEMTQPPGVTMTQSVSNLHRCHRTPELPAKGTSATPACLTSGPCSHRARQTKLPGGAGQ